MSDRMDIGALLAEQLQRLLGDRIDRAALVTLEQNGLSATLWQQIDDLGITQALVSEDAGGAGLLWSDVEPAFRLAGEYAAPVPLVETIIGNWALTLAGLDNSGIPLSLLDTSATLGSDGSISVDARIVAWAPVSTQLVTVAQRGDEHFLCVLASHDCEIHPLETIARIPSGTVAMEAIKPQQIAALPSAIGVNGLQPFLAAARAVQIAGALARVLELCIEYGNTRTQFGKPIGKFQAIQHQLAELAEHTAAAQVAGLYACRQIDAGNAAYGAAIAKTFAGKAATRGAAIAHQVFGAIGVTDEHLLHYFTRRLWQWRTENGSEQFWSEQLGRRVLAQPGAALWPSIADTKATAPA